MLKKRHARGQPSSADPRGAEVFDAKTWQDIQRALKLCRREVQIVRHIFNDHKERAIGTALGISPHTVNTYTQRLYRKLGVNSRAQLIVHIVGVAGRVQGKR